MRSPLSHKTEKLMAKDWKHFNFNYHLVYRDKTGWASFMFIGQANCAVLCLLECGCVLSTCIWKHISAYMWLWALCACIWFNEDIQNIRVGTMPSGHGEGAVILSFVLQCSNQVILRERGRWKSRYHKITIALYLWISRLCVCQVHIHNFISGVGLDRSKTRRLFVSF